MLGSRCAYVGAQQLHCEGQRERTVKSGVFSLAGHMQS